jgi:hypothetical protein
MHDESREIRFSGAEALGKLAVHSTKVIPLATDLKNSIEKCSDPEFYSTYCHALRLVLESAGKKLSTELRDEIIELMEENIRLGIFLLMALIKKY